MSNKKPQHTRPVSKGFSYRTTCSFFIANFAVKGIYEIGQTFIEAEWYNNLKSNFIHAQMPCMFLAFAYDCKRITREGLDSKLH